ncbi:hypothetical protein VIGAN_09177500 [Vigna angularis var. angularis]|uniref:Uncharacterized protein n=1 Tax=Vigna angularis var. angularis TaxID=157739 RepID=A0A0S3SZK6_PHAAN|nr:hypothetical protein VIGAN_09177500 [Vigna angularis var. angularis]
MDAKPGKWKGMLTYQTAQFAAGNGGEERTVRKARPRGAHNHMPRASDSEFGDGSTTCLAKTYELHWSSYCRTFDQSEWEKRVCEKVSREQCAIGSME